MATKVVEQSHIIQDKGVCGGQPRIAGTRIKVQHIIQEYERLGWTPDQICDAHPGLTLADVHAAITYYYDHKDETGNAMQDEEDFVEYIQGSE